MLATGSELQRLAVCIGGARGVLPRVIEVEPSDAAARGTAIHAFLATVGTLGREEALARVPEEWRSACEVIDLDQLPQIDPKEYAHELAFAFDLNTAKGRVLGTVGDGPPYLTREQAYASLGMNELGCTLDICALTTDGRGVFIADIKTGRKAVASAARNLQLMLGAIAMSRAFDRAEATVAIIYTHDDGTSWFDRATFDAMDMDAIEVDLCALADRIHDGRELVAAGGRPELVLGQHCNFCPSKRGCPGRVETLAAITADPAAEKRTVRELLTPERAAIAYRRIKVAKQLITDAETELYFFAQSHPIDLGDGVVYGVAPGRKTTLLDGKVTHRVLEEAYGRAVADEACTLEAGVGAVEKALVRVRQERAKETPPGMKPPAQAAITREAMERLRNAGAVRVSYGEPKPKEFRPLVASRGDGRSTQGEGDDNG